MEQNICKFVLDKNTGKDLYVLHYVYETKQQIFDGWKFWAHNRIGFVKTGEGKLITQYGEYNLKKGDVFFTLASVPFALQSLNNFTYYYISFTGNIAEKQLYELKINQYNLVFNGFEKYMSLWETGTSLPLDAIEMFSEGLLLCMFSIIAKDVITKKSLENKLDISLKIKKYIDENFYNPDLTVNEIALHFSYNKKYISDLFSRKFKIHLSNYINDLRIEQACSLIEKGYTSVKTISNMSGFYDQLYFSKVFKKKTGLSPKERINEISNK